MSWARKALGTLFVSHTKASLEILTREFGFPVRNGDLQSINSNWYVTHTGLIGLARCKRCRGSVKAADSQCNAMASRFVLKATVIRPNIPPFLSATAMPTRPTSLLARARRRDPGSRNQGGQSRFAQGVRSATRNGGGSPPNRPILKASLPPNIAGCNSLLFRNRLAARV
jgi:hypothetical protein